MNNRMNLEVINELDNWRRYQCIRMPIADDSNRCITPDGTIGSCYRCRYHVRNIYRIQ